MKEQYEIDRIVSLENLKKFIILNYLSFKKEKNEIEKILLENKDLFLMKAPKLIVRGNEVIPYKFFGKHIVVKVNNLKEIVTNSENKKTILNFIPLNENEGRLIGKVSPKTIVMFHLSKAFSSREIEEILIKNKYDKIFQLEEAKIEEEKLKRIELLLKEKAKIERRDENEIEALKIAISKEIKENRKRIELASIKEHYDIISYGNNENDVKYIEVKTHKKLSKANFIRLSKNEYEIAKEKKDKYWIYLVFYINNIPKIVKIQNPIEKLDWIKLFDEYFSLILF